MADVENSIKQGNPSRPLRAVLLGFSGSGKRSSQNIILNQQSQGRNYNKVQAEVAGQQVIMVNTPGWNNKLSSAKTPEQIHEEIERGISQCHPGPHAVLLVVSADTRFSEKHRGHFEEYVQLLGERVWSHSMVLFTYGGRLTGTTVEEHIDREGRPLQWLVEKCGNRYHVLDNRSCVVGGGGGGGGDGGTQVMELLEKMERMVVGNEEEYFKYVRRGKDGLETVEVGKVAEEEDCSSWVNHSSPRRRNSQQINRPSLGGEDKPVTEPLSPVSAPCGTPTTRRQSSGYGSDMLSSSTTSLNSSVFGTCQSSFDSEPADLD